MEEFGRWFENRGGLNGGVGGLCEDRGPEEMGE